MFSKFAYWLFTGLLIAWLAVGGAFDISRAPAALTILHTLGYPPYLCLILGSAKLLAIAALLFPKSGILREWAYAGIAFDGLGAFFSHVAVNDVLTATIAPVVFLLFAAASYMLRPAHYRLHFKTESSRTAEAGSVTLA